MVEFEGQSQAILREQDGVAPRLWGLTVRDFTLTVGFLIVMLVAHITGERIPVANGLGYDHQYGRWASSFVEEVIGKKVDAYYICRVLPSGVVYASLQLLGVPLDTGHVVQGFVALNIVCIALATVLWWLIAAEMGLRPLARWLGFLGLFVNYAVLKWSAYDPVMTDMPAYLTSMVMAYCYLTRMPMRVALATLFGSFIWPTMLPMGVLMMAFPRPGAVRADGSSPSLLPTVLSGLAAIAFVGYAYYLRNQHYEIPFGAAQPIQSLWNISLVVAVVYLLTGLRVLLGGGGVLRPGAWHAHLSVRGGVLSILVFAVAQLAYTTLSSGPSEYNLLHRINFTVFTALAKPGIFYLADVLFYGPLLLLALFAWRPTCRRIHAEGPGLTACALLALGLSLCSEPRSLLSFYPLFMPFLAKALDEQAWPESIGFFVGVAAIGLSKCWLIINSGPFTGYTFQLPDQAFFLSYGPWISPAMYLLQAPVVACFVWMFYRVSRTAGSPGAAGVPASVPLPESRNSYGEGLSEDMVAS